VIGRRAATLLLGLLVAVIVAAAVAAKPERQPSDGHHRTIGFGQTAFDFAGPEKWAARYRAERRKVAVLKRELREQRRLLIAKPNVGEAINLAAMVYGNQTTLWRKARCETGGTFDPGARNRSSNASGLFQFLPSTWRSTPYAPFSVWSPYANALAAGWMHKVGRGGEWSCR
jgi:hypothetical protein